MEKLRGFEKIRGCSFHSCPMTRDDKELDLDKEHEEKDVSWGKPGREGGGELAAFL